MDVSDRRLHVQLTQEAKIASDFSLIRAIFAFAGFVSALSGPNRKGWSRSFALYRLISTSFSYWRTISSHSSPPGTPLVMQ